MDRRDKGWDGGGSVGGRGDRGWIGGWMGGWAGRQERGIYGEGSVTRGEESYGATEKSLAGQVGRCRGADSADMEGGRERDSR